MNTVLFPELAKIIFLSNRSNLKDEYKLQGFLNRSYYANIKEEPFMIALQDFLNKLSEYCGYKVNLSKSTVRGVMKIHLESEKKSYR